MSICYREGRIEAQGHFDYPRDTNNIQRGISKYTSNNKSNSASSLKIGIQTTKNNRVLKSINRQLQNIQKQVNKLAKKLGK